MDTLVSGMYQPKQHNTSVNHFLDFKGKKHKIYLYLLVIDIFRGRALKAPLKLMFHFVVIFKDYTDCLGYFVLIILRLFSMSFLVYKS